MNLRRALCLCALLPLWSGGALADTVAVDQLIGGKDTLTVIDEQKFDAGPPHDPQIVVRRLRRGSVHFHGLSFSFDAPSGSGIFDFFNANDFGLAELVFTPAIKRSMEPTPKMVNKISLLAETQETAST